MKRAGLRVLLASLGFVVAGLSVFGGGGAPPILRVVIGLMGLLAAWAVIVFAWRGGRR